MTWKVIAKKGVPGTDSSLLLMGNQGICEQEFNIDLFPEIRSYWFQMVIESQPAQVNH